MTDTTTAELTVRPTASTIQQWWVLTVRMLTPTLRNGELATQIVGSIVFTIGYYIPLSRSWVRRRA